jgi:hypothetical protein
LQNRTKENKTMNKSLLFSSPLLILCSLFSVSAMAADDVPRLVNLDGTGITAKGALSAGIDHRSLNTPESLAYTSLSFRWGLFKDLEVGARGVTASTKDFVAANGAIIRHGGQDAEVYGKYRVGSFGGAHLAILGGASFANTPAQRSTFGTVSGVGEYKVHDRVTLLLNPRAIFIEDNTIAGIGVGASVRIADRVHLVGDWTKVVTGDNTRSISDGTRIRKDVWGAAVRFTSGGEGVPVDFDIGWGNGTGSTTGFSLTPGLGNSAGFYLALHARH